MGIVKGLRRYFRVDQRPQLSPEELVETRILKDALYSSEAPQLLIAEKVNKWCGVGEIISAEELIRDEKDGSYRLETAMAYPKPKDPKIVVAVGAYRLGIRRFGVYVASNGQRVFDGVVGDERLRIELGRAIGGITANMARQGIF